MKIKMVFVAFIALVPVLLCGTAYCCDPIVPEPVGCALFALGGGCFALIRKLRNR